MKIGRNCDVTPDDKTKTVNVKLTVKSLGPSKSGKTEMFATSDGNKVVIVNGEEYRLGINFYKP